MTINGQTVQDLIIGIGLIGGILVYSRTRLPRQTIKDLQNHSDAQDKAIKDLQEENKQHIKTIAQLQGQIKVYKELPLKELAEGIKKVAEGQDKILEELQKSSGILASTANDGGLLVRTNEDAPVTVKMEKK